MLWNGLRELPSTNWRIFVSVCLEVVFAFVVLFCMATERKVAVDVVWAIGILITGWLGLGVAQFGWQRNTDRGYAAIKNPPAPSAVTVEAPSQVNVTSKTANASDTATAAVKITPTLVPQHDALPSQGERGDE
jgi:hypothetical protein